MKNYLQKRNYVRDPFFDMFDDFFKPVFYDDSADSMRTDIKETENGYQLDVEMPGFDKKDIKIALENGYLTVSAQKSSKDEEGNDKNKNERYIRKECTVSCSRSYYVGNDVEKENVKAKYENGMLTLNVPKSQPKQLPSHNIEIE
ncbi:MAG TPA: Hsp20/alpha crystallin family protein [Candidatus Coproplasma excrementigallinarum]|uniref:Hsp20/alpha crystallin family protein n=1 Tax=Candidatus Coproplasma excrementigallinarum TaxID=2840747 RepID=A0A9D1SJG6_9FIRM|nr:Hsp20/alpha crystallin family protein [Candidatus Coproplasma excrementigallinarum]